MCCASWQPAGPSTAWKNCSPISGSSCRTSRPTRRRRCRQPLRRAPASLPEPHQPATRHTQRRARERHGADHGFAGRLLRWRFMPMCLREKLCAVCSKERAVGRRERERRSGADEQVGHLASAGAAGGSSAGAIVPGGSSPRSRARDARRVVPRLAGDEPRWLHARRERYAGERARLRPSRQFPRSERDRSVSATAARRVGGERHACDRGSRVRSLRNERAQAGCSRTAASDRRDAVPGRSGLAQL
jgi:hypothetical protein